MNFWTPEHIRSLAGGSWLALPATGTEPTGLSTDSRTIKAGQIFLALAGERFDGHAMAGAAAAAGSPIAIVENPQAMPTPFPPAMGVLKVASTERALLKLAAAYRRTLEGTRVIAVCGSNGKTTTVRMIQSVLSQTMRGTASIKSFNNHIGVPLTVLSARPVDQFLICEIGTNAPGEIAQLSRAVSPDVAVITSLGREHLELLGSLHGVAMEEASVLEFVRPGGAGIINGDVAELTQVVAGLQQKPKTILSFGTGKQVDVRVASVEQDFEGVTFTLNDRSQFRLPLLGGHNAVNAAAAVAVGRRLGLKDDQIAAGLQRASGAEMRLEQMQIGGVRVLNDAYNANPDSMHAALQTFTALGATAKRRVLVLGNMLELGEQGPELHAGIGDAIAAMPTIDVVILIGTLMRHAADRLAEAPWVERVHHMEELDSVQAGNIAQMLQPGDLVLLKGSRGMKLERIVEAMRKNGSGSVTLPAHAVKQASRVANA